MGFLLNILLALGSLAVAGAGLGTQTQLPAAVPLLCTVPHGLGWIARRLSLKGRFRSAAVANAAIGFSAPLLQIVAIQLLGWAGSVEGVLGTRVTFEDWPGPELLLGLLPYVLFELCAIDARARLFDERREARRDLWRFHSRMLASALLPLLLFIGVTSLIELNADLAIALEEVAILNGIFVGLLLLSFALVLPSILRNTWETAPIEAGWLRDLLEGVAARAGFRCKEILIWKTGNLMANAAVIGFLPRHRIVLLSDALLAQLGPEELAAVFAHEIGHARRHHALVFGSYALGFFLWADLLIGWLEPGSATAEVGIFAGLVLLWYLSFGYLSRRFELDADLVSLEVVGDSAALTQALELVGGAHGRRRSSWRHFSTERRVGFLGAVERDPSKGKRLRRKLRTWSIAGFVLFVAGLGLELHALSGSLGRDRVVVDLRLGRYEEATRRARSEGLELDPSLRALLERAGTVEPGDRTPEGLLERSRHALWSGDLPAAMELFGLADLLGIEDPAVLFEAFSLAADGRPEPTLTFVQAAAPAWENAFRLYFEQTSPGTGGVR